MNKVAMLKELNSNKKYLGWSELEKFANENNLEINYQNKYISWLVGKEYSICIECKNCYGSQMIESFS